MSWAQTSPPCGIIPQFFIHFFQASLTYIAIGTPYKNDINHIKIVHKKYNRIAKCLANRDEIHFMYEKTSNTVKPIPETHSRYVLNSKDRRG